MIENRGLNDALCAEVYVRNMKIPVERIFEKICRKKSCASTVAKNARINPTDLFGWKTRGIPLTKIGALISLCDKNNNVNYIDLVVPCNNKGKKSIGLLFLIISKRYMLARHMIKKPEDFKYTMNDFSDE